MVPAVLSPDHVELDSKSLWHYSTFSNESVARKKGERFLFSLLLALYLEGGGNNDACSSYVRPREVKYALFRLFRPDPSAHCIDFCLLPPCPRKQELSSRRILASMKDKSGVISNECLLCGKVAAAIYSISIDFN